MLKLKVDAMSQKEKLCCITMDEFAIKPSLDYDSKSDSFLGNVTLPGHENQGKATKCLVFQIGGVMLRYKQIVAYYFTGNLVILWFHLTHQFEQFLLCCLFLVKFAQFFPFWGQFSVWPWGREAKISP